MLFDLAWLKFIIFIFLLPESRYNDNGDQYWGKRDAVTNHFQQPGCLEYIFLVGIFLFYIIENVTKYNSTYKLYTYYNKIRTISIYYLMKLCLFCYPFSLVLTTLVDRNTGKNWSIPHPDPHSLHNPATIHLLSIF